MKQLPAMLRLDIRLVFRDKIIWYVLFFPAVIAVILLLVSGYVKDNTPTLAICPHLPQTASASLEKVAKLDMQTDRASLEKRVNGFDNAAGVVWEDGAAHVIFQGNEDSEYQKQTAALVDAALNRELPDFRLIDTSSSKAFPVQIIMAALFLAPALIGGSVSGFLIVDEKENRMLRGYQIAPVSFLSYIGGRSLLASMIGVLCMLLLCLLSGTVNQIGMLGLILLCSLPLFGVVAILFGSLAKDKISCIAMFKILVIVFLVLPLSSAFVPARFHGFFYPLPVYWQFQAVLQALNNRLNLQYCGITFITGTILFTAVILIFHDRLLKRKENF